MVQPLFMADSSSHFGGCLLLLAAETAIAIRWDETSRSGTAGLIPRDYFASTSVWGINVFSSSKVRFHGRDPLSGSASNPLSEDFFSSCCFLTLANRRLASSTVASSIKYAIA